ncbi:tRNA pseudouridine(38-40) synthase TruA [Zunongwangia profunda]|uniref:tRNA pseudouridine synthase A n=2 Tax=Zunongwangia profunda TaxID=398743 RepID=D5BHT2_ZUNPS|nr:tRNA pseudouridine(38-40) synthase TruA [Zunongwangia profunda]MAC63777.1 tRNA pseudouridine(38-40) synthase TruA [Flavobacteriaceae bacterium]MAS69675.1 tRNA pseudouridine(38-40) synthase TruA [Zunongwangia sp.]ADF51320.1 tRNA pseudouridine synthase A [Zunongwangia profunda SM-A87]MAG86466.1 tRNA pseudouridine(38-40) synthase TruA [Flavobacteriaceae bacterium]HCV82231.1 tRNA pseudouridine(38-40) synthase TruA [Zunongwangia profunda]
MRYFIDLAYLGTAYHGWQIQPEAVSVQQVLQEALSKILQQNIEVVGAGRTDAGVHATQMYAHFDADLNCDEKTLQFKLNSFLPKDISIRQLFKVQSQAHARFDACSRSYEYHIVNFKDPFKIDLAYYLLKQPDIEKMNHAAAMLKDYTNFKCFSKSRTDVKTYNCNITAAFWEQSKDELIFHITADRFLRNMVRAIVGTLLDIGLGKNSVEFLKEILKSEDRSMAGTSVPAHGLYLTRIEYPKTALFDGL